MEDRIYYCPECQRTVKIFAGERFICTHCGLMADRLYLVYRSREDVKKLAEHIAKEAKERDGQETDRK